MPLFTSRIGAADATRHLVMLHGIYGRGRNWQTIAKGLVAARPEYTCWLVDLPHHGDSGAGNHGNTVAGLAADVDDWLTTEVVTPTAVLGHSYGGKVALALAARRPAQPLQIWVIDSTPEAKAPSGSAFDMLRVIRAMPPDFATREDAITGLVAAGYAPGVAQWMSTNLQRDGDRFTWQLDFAVMDELLADFFTSDLWAVIESPAAEHQFHFLKASESHALSAAAVHRIEGLPRDRVTLHHRPGGHWIHSESPVEVVSLLSMHLPR